MTKRFPLLSCIIIVITIIPIRTMSSSVIMFTCLWRDITHIARSAAIGWKRLTMNEALSFAGGWTHYLMYGASVSGSERPTD